MTKKTNCYISKPLIYRGNQARTDCYMKNVQVTSDEQTEYLNN